MKGKELPYLTSRRLILHFDVNKTILMKDSIMSLDSVKLTVLAIKVMDFIGLPNHSQCSLGTRGDHRRWKHTLAAST